MKKNSTRYLEVATRIATELAFKLLPRRIVSEVHGIHLLKNELETVLRCVNAVTFHQVLGTPGRKIRVANGSLCIATSHLKRAKHIKGSVLRVVLGQNFHIVMLKLGELRIDTLRLVLAARKQGESQSVTLQVLSKL